MVKGRGTKYEGCGNKVDMGIGQHPQSNKNPLGKGTGPTFNTGKQVYSENTGKADKGVV